MISVLYKYKTTLRNKFREYPYKRIGVVKKQNKKAHAGLLCSNKDPSMLFQVISFGEEFLIDQSLATLNGFN